MSDTNPYKVVEQFESELCAYTGAKYAVTTNSCSMAITLALAFHLQRGDSWRSSIDCPKRTYASVPMAISMLGARIKWTDEDWSGAYQLRPLPVWDSARRFVSGMYPRFGSHKHFDNAGIDTGNPGTFFDELGKGQFVCVSFQTSKILGLEQGGAILHDNAEADTWMRRARFDGRLNAEEKLPQQIGWHCYMNPSTAAIGLQRLACLPRDNPDQAGAADFADLSELPCFR